MQTSDLFCGPVPPAVESLHQATAVYTRTALIDEVLDTINWPAPGRLLDPGAGDGAFAARAIERLDPFPAEGEAVHDRVHAWEIHPLAADAARQRIAQTLSQRGWSPHAARAEAAMVVREGDYLTHETETRFDFIAGNPPYIRFARLPAEFKELYRQAIPAFARHDLLHAFLNNCFDHLTPTGCVSLITSDRWLFNRQAQQLRTKIGEKWGIDSITRLSTKSAFYRPKRRARGSLPRIHPVLTVLVPADRAIRPLSKDPTYPDDAYNLTVPPEAARLGNVATLRIAPWLGTRGVFVHPTESADRFPANSWVPAIDTSNLSNGGPLTPHLIALRTDHEEPHPDVRDHLLSTSSQLAPRARRDPPWLPPESWGPLPYSTDAIVIPRIAKNLRPTILPAGVLPLDHNITVISSTLDPHRLMQALTADLPQQWIRTRAPRLENGYLSITTNLLRRLPILI